MSGDSAFMYRPPRQRAKLERVALAANTLRRISLPPNPLQQARADLTRAMAEAREQGFTLQQIGDAAGITKQRVSQLLNKGEKCTD